MLLLIFGSFCDPFQKLCIVFRHVALVMCIKLCYAFINKSGVKLLFLLIGNHKILSIIPSAI